MRNYLFTLSSGIMLVLFASSCGDEQTSTTMTESKTDIAIKPLAVMESSINTNTSVPCNLELTKGAFTTFDPQIAPTLCIDSATAIANVLMNSDEFADSLRKLSFAIANDCGCNPEVKKHSSESSIGGGGIYEVLLLICKPIINMAVKKSAGALGDTRPCTTNINCYYYPIMTDMGRQLPFSGGLAVNLCHEYMHSLGYCHTPGSMRERDRRPDGERVNAKHYNNDVAYRVGWIMYDILNRRRNKENKPYPYN